MVNDERDELKHALRLLINETLKSLAPDALAHLIHDELIAYCCDQTPADTYDAHQNHLTTCLVCVAFILDVSHFKIFDATTKNERAISDAEVRIAWRRLKPRIAHTPFL